MKPIFFTIDNSLSLKIIPDTQFHIDGHPVLTYNYNIFFNNTKHDPTSVLKTDKAADKLTDPDYLGYISFEQPGRVFSYTPGNQRELTRDEIEEIIEKITHYRDNPNSWAPGDN